jgi:hypothetical protein
MRAMIVFRAHPLAGTFAHASHVFPWVLLRQTFLVHPFIRACSLLANVRRALQPLSCGQYSGISPGVELVDYFSNHLALPISQEAENTLDCTVRLAKNCCARLHENLVLRQLACFFRKIRIADSAVRRGEIFFADLNI